MSADTIVIVDGARTPVGSFGGVSKKVPADALGATAARAALARRRRGERHPRGPDGLHRPGGTGSLLTRGGSPSRPGCLRRVPAYTVTGSAPPGSPLRAIWSAAMEMRWNGLDLALAGGEESMTRMPFYDFGARSGYKLGDRSLVDGTVMMLTNPFNEIQMGVTAENVATKGVSPGAGRVRCRVPAPRRAASDAAKRALAEEITEVEVGGRKPFTVTENLYPKPGTTLETLAGLRPAFAKDGTVTAGNASGINDGAAAVVLATERAAAERGLTPLVSLEAVATEAMEPKLMGYAPS